MNRNFLDHGSNLGKTDGRSQMHSFKIFNTHPTPGWLLRSSLIGLVAMTGCGLHEVASCSASERRHGRMRVAPGKQTSRRRLNGLSLSSIKGSGEWVGQSMLEASPRSGYRGFVGPGRFLTTSFSRGGAQNDPKERIQQSSIGSR